jgi:hypothetical protein
MKKPRAAPDIYWEIVEHCPVTHRWQKHMLLTLAKEQSQTKAPVHVDPYALARTGFTPFLVMEALRSLVQGGHIYANTDGTYYVKRPRKTGRWRWEKR